VEFGPVATFKVAVRAPVAALQIDTVPLTLPVAIRRLSGLNSISGTVSVVLPSENRNFPLVAFQILGEECKKVDVATCRQG
jgi:hypothetical protein